MIILSNFTDYYDFASKVFYNGDPRQVRWERIFERIKDNLHIKFTDSFYRVGRYALDKTGDWHNRDIDKGYFGLVICEEIYYFLFERKKAAVNYCFVSTPDDFDYHLIDKSDKKFQEWIYPLDDKVRALQTKYRTPLILIKRYDELYINPKLVNLSVAKYIDPHQLYQKIEGWFTDGRFNVEQPSPMTDKEKIQSHGFDTRTSFRHPVKYE